MEKDKIKFIVIASPDRLKAFGHAAQTIKWKLSGDDVNQRTKCLTFYLKEAEGIKANHYSIGEAFDWNDDHLYYIDDVADRQLAYDLVRSIVKMLPQTIVRDLDNSNNSAY